jgi:hypothetical protein
MTCRMSEVTTEEWKGTAEPKCDKRADRWQASKVSFEDYNFESGNHSDMTILYISHIDLL